MGGAAHTCAMSDSVRVAMSDALRPRSSVVSPDALVPAVRGALLTLTERADDLTAELSEVSGQLERCRQRLSSPPDPDPAQLR